MSEHKLQVSLDGLVQLLSRNLYDSPDVFLRELLQNAHDAIVKRRLLELHTGIIRIQLRPASGQLVITDDGIGLTREAIDEHLSTIGRSGTDEVRRSMMAGAAQQLIGQFGIGLLAAFLVASRVDVHTASAETGECWRWRFEGGATYQVVAGDPRPTGTEVLLTLRREALEFLRYERVSELVIRFGDLLDVPIFIDDDRSPSNTITPPWSAGVGSGQVEAYIERRLTQVELGLSMTFDVPLGEGRVQGALAIPNSVGSVGVEGKVALYVRRMFITERQQGLMPSWASFFVGVVQCDQLTPTASRERVLQDEELDQVQKCLHEILLAQLSQWMLTHRGELAMLLRRHANTMLPLICEPENLALFRELASLVPFPTLSRPATISELNRINPDGPRLRYTTRNQGQSVLRLMAESRGLPVLDLSSKTLLQFAQCYARIWPHELELVRLDGEEMGELCQQVSSDERSSLEPLVRVFRSLVEFEQIELGRFAPSILPLVRMETKRGRAARELREVEQRIGLPDFIRVATTWAHSPAENQALVILNIDAPAIAAMASYAQKAPFGDEILDMAARLLLERAREDAGALRSQESRRQGLKDLAHLVAQLLASPG